MRSLWLAVTRGARRARDVVLDPVVSVPLTALVVLVCCALWGGDVALVTTSSRGADTIAGTVESHETTIAAPLWLVVLAVYVVAAIVLALVAYALGDDE